MADQVRVIGSYLSPYVRKVLVVLDLKGIPYEIDPIIPYFGDERFSQLSPIRAIPVFIDDKVSLCDSSVICQYLEDRYPTPALYPADIADRARARWLEEYADTRMGEVIIWRLFNQVAIGPGVWGEMTDPAVLDRTLNKDLPHVLDYVESQLPADGFFFGTLSIADISIASFFRNARFAMYRIDESRWPKAAAFVKRMHQSESFLKLKPYEDRCIRTMPLQHREVLAELGAPLTKESYGTATPRRGMMRGQ